MTSEIPHFVDGARRPGTSGRSADVMNPSTGAVQATVPLASVEEVNEVVASSVAAQRVWAAWNPQKRARVMMRFVDLVNQNADELAELLSIEHGKTIADAHGDIQRGVEVIEFAIGIPHLLKGEFTEGAGTGIDVHSVRQPLGVVAGITPFNFPAMIPLWKAGPALACGNAFILKPSERDPSVPLRLAELFLEAGLPAGVFQVVHGDKVAVDALLTHPDVQALGFVGSSDIAQYIYETAAANGKRSQCFGGAKNHMIILPDADLDQAVDALIGAGYGSAGERCMAISVAVPVGEETANRLRDRLIDRVTALRVGHSHDPKADYGPLVSGAALERVRDYIGQGVDAGADLVVDGRDRASDDLTFGDEQLEAGYFIGPTLFDHVTKEMSIYTDEIFGPVLCIVRAGDYEEALALASDHQYGNGVAIFTQDGDAARDFCARVQVGMVGVNVPIPVPVAYHTFGGWKRSGFGDLNQHGPAAIQFYTKVKTITTRWPSGIKDGAEFSIPHDAVSVLDATLSADDRVITDTAAAFAAKRIAPHALAWDAEKHFPAEELREAAELGMAAIYCSEEFGGSGLTRLDGVRIFTELAAADPTTAAFLSIHNMATWMVDCYGTAEQRATWVPRMASMECIASYCLTEPSAGSDAAALRTRADRDGDDFVLNGVKQFISGAGTSDVYIVMARTGGDGPKGISTFIVENGTPGLSFGAQEKKMGWHAQPTAAVVFDDVRVPAANMVGGDAGEGTGFRIAMNGLNGGRINIAACSLGGAQDAMARTRRYLREREAFGGSLIDEPTIRFALADMAIDLEASRLMLWNAAAALDADHPDKVTSCAMAKRFVTERCFSVADQALQLHGGYGYLHDYGLEKIVRDLRVNRILEGTNEIMRMVIGRAIAKENP